jgi:SNF2 family DNA or RNA helicase
MTTADIDSGRIIVRPSLADLFVCRQIPGSRWDAARKAWSLPATVATATLLRKRLRSVSESDRLRLFLTNSVTINLDAERSTALLADAVVPSNVVPLAPPVPDALPAPAPQEPEVVVELPTGLRTKPWRHQRIAYKFCLDHFAQGQHGILLAMGMGTGKSLVACLLLLGLGARRVLISCPLRVVPVWLTQFERHVAIDMVVVALDEDIDSVAKKMELAQDKLRLAEARGVPFVAVINYDSAWREPFAEWAEKQRWDLVIADKAHRIKAPGGKASMFFKRLRTKALHRVLLTGTPMPHGPMDIFAPLRFADITVFGPSFAAFRQKYAVMGGYLRKQITGFQKLDELERLMSRVTYRVGKEVLDLPPETDVTYHCDLGSEARRNRGCPAW